MPKRESLYRQPPTPTDPTGRHVISDLDGIKNGGQQLVHWPPNAEKTGQYAWSCPDCARWFHWSVDDRVWREATA